MSNNVPFIRSAVMAKAMIWQWIDQWRRQCPLPAWDVTTAYAHCLAVARSHYENFPVLSHLFSLSQRQALAAIYSFARFADDLADEPQLGISSEQRVALLQRLSGEIQHREVRHPFLLAVYDTLDRWNIAPRWLQKLLVAFRYDAAFRPLPSWADVYWYCDHSANPVGRMVLALAQVDSTPSICAAADALCTALQLVNFWQDLTVDRQRKRCYIPLEVLEAAGVTLDDYFAQRLKASQKQQILEQVLTRTREVWQTVWPLFPELPVRWRLFIQWIAASGMAMTAKLQHCGPALFDSSRPVLRNRDFLRIFTRWLKLWRGKPE